MLQGPQGIVTPAPPRAAPLPRVPRSPCMIPGYPGSGQVPSSARGGTWAVTAPGRFASSAPRPGAFPRRLPPARESAGQRPRRGQQLGLRAGDDVGPALALDLLDDGVGDQAVGAVPMYALVAAGAAGNRVGSRRRERGKTRSVATRPTAATGVAPMPGVIGPAVRRSAPAAGQRGRCAGRTPPPCAPAPSAAIPGRARDRGSSRQHPDRAPQPRTGL